MILRLRRAWRALRDVPSEWVIEAVVGELRGERWLP